jgi:hypothetical protein
MTFMDTCINLTLLLYMFMFLCPFAFTFLQLAARNMPCYVVFHGRNTGVYESWGICNEQVSGCPGASCMSCPTRSQAEAAYADFLNHDSQKVKPQQLVLASNVKPGAQYWTWKDVVILVQFLVILVLCYKIM